jgi:hypothetical protein
MEEDYNHFLKFFYNKSIHKILDITRCENDTLQLINKIADSNNRASGGIGIFIKD